SERWSDGVTVGFSESKHGTGRLFFINTPHGIAVTHPRLHDGKGLDLGMYLRVLTTPPRLGSHNMEVVDFVWAQRPADHEIGVTWNRVNVQCNVHLVAHENGWFIFNNTYLGLLGMREVGDLREKNLRTGCAYRVICRREKTNDGLPQNGDPILWVIEDIDYADRETVVDEWFVGIVTRCKEQLAIITSFDLPTDCFLYDWNRGDPSISPDDLLSRWVRFQVDDRRANDHGLRYRIRDNFSEIESQCETRVKERLTEIRVNCRYTGEMEDSRPILRSWIGFIRDHDGIIDERDGEGEYEFWVVKHHRLNHTARWKLSIYDNEPVKIDNRREMELEQREERRFDNDSLSNSSVNEASSHYQPSTSQYSAEEEWTTVILTGESSGDWFASCGREDIVVIPKCLVESLDQPRRGDFYRIKLGRFGCQKSKAAQLDPCPIHPKDFEVCRNEDIPLMVWCFAKIVKGDCGAFTLFNEILGEATFHRKYAAKCMKVGDEIEAQYYRVRKSENATLWMVRMTRVCMSRIKTSQENINWSSTANSMEEVTLDNLVEKDRRILDIMRHFFNIPQVLLAFEKNSNETMRKIERILRNDLQEISVDT
ncbi:hypothetical protein PFISCL1PPCAC_16272, partial [Pristionchus fissidentatus]